MRREDEISKLEDISDAVEGIIRAKRQEIDEDPLFVHPAEVKDRIEELEPVKNSLRPAPVVLHLDGIRVKIPYAQWKDQIAGVEVYGRELGDIARIKDSRLGGSTLIEIKTMSEVMAEDAKHGDQKTHLDHYSISGISDLRRWRLYHYFRYITECYHSDRKTGRI